MAQIERMLSMWEAEAIGAYFFIPVAIYLPGGRRWIIYFSS
jgi:hypothetical protein